MHHAQLAPVTVSPSPGTEPNHSGVASQRSTSPVEFIGENTASGPGDLKQVIPASIQNVGQVVGPYQGREINQRSGAREAVSPTTPAPASLAGAFICWVRGIRSTPLALADRDGPSGSLPVFASQLLQGDGEGRGTMARERPSTDPATAGVVVDAEHLIGAVLLRDEPDKSSGMESQANSWLKTAMTQLANAMEL